MARDFTKEDSNKVLVQASFDRWKSGTGGPFELLALMQNGPLLAHLRWPRLITVGKNSSTL